MNDLRLALSAEERDYLLRLLSNTLGETRVEVHHTNTPGYREKVLQEESMIRRLMEKLQATG